MAGCFYSINGRSLCGEEMTSVPDGLSEAGSGHNQVSAAHESAGFSCGARGNVCQQWSSCPRQKRSPQWPWPQAVSLLFRARAQL